MIASALHHCLPLLLLLAGCVLVLRLLAGAVGVRPSLARLRTLHRCESGAVQSLSFILAFPVFAFVMVMIVQATHMIHGVMVVHYAAFAAARSAVVWIPAETPGEPGNYVTSFGGPETLGDQVYLHRIEPTGGKYDRVLFATAVALAPICPSREIEGVPPAPSHLTDALGEVYAAMATQGSEFVDDQRIRERITRQVSYALEHTELELEFVHDATERGGNDLPLFGEPVSPSGYGAPYGIDPDPMEHAPGEIGWQDAITARVTHYMAMLPGPATLLFAESNYETRGSYGSGENVYVYKIVAAATLPNEGQQPVVTYVENP